MQTMLNKWRDKSRELLFKASRILGETDSFKPSSLKDKRDALASLNVSLPAFQSLLPYETVDEEGFFVNRNSVGFGFNFAPVAGADEGLMKSMAELFKNKLPAGCDCTFMLFKHHYLAGDLSRGFSPILESGGIYAELARLSLDFHLKALKEGYPNSRNVPAQLADYQGYLFVSIKRQEDYQARLKKIRDDFISELKVAGFLYAPLSADEFCTLVRALVSPDLNEISWPKVLKNKDAFLSEQMANPSSVFSIDDSGIDVSFTKDDASLSSTRVVNCALTGLSKQPFALWQTPDFFANLLKPDQGIQCPFLISFTVRGMNQETMKSLAKRRAKSLNANANAIQSFLNPGLLDEASEWHLAYNESSKGDLHLLPVFYNLVLFTTKDLEREHVAKAISAYRQCGFTLTPSRLTQWLRFCGSLPFMLTEGLFDSLKILGLTHTMSHYNVANLVPVVADFKGSRTGLLLPTYRHQLFYYDPFDDKHLPITNYNRLTVASTGSGKSYLQQAMILDGLSRGDQIFVIDLGASYKNLCERVGGTYLDVTTLALNPFTLFDFDGVTDIKDQQINDYVQIRDLLALMASPNHPLDEVQRSWLLDATLMAWKKLGRGACIDDVLKALEELLESAQSRNDRRLKDLIVLLSKYGRDGIYGEMFNGVTPLFNGRKLTVLEMGGLGSNKELLTIVLFVMIVIIQGQFYQGDRRLRKQCVIDEAWRFLKDSTNPIAAEFIEQGFRTARKHSGGFSVITQNLMDTSNSVCGQAIEASSDTKIIMRQGNFKDYVARFPDAFTPLQQQMISSFGEAKMQGFSNLMIKYGNACTYHRYFSDPYSRVLFSTSGDEFGAVEAMVASGVSLTDAVSRISKELYGEDV
jgi:conjugal transfer ATP-binding protein TraC